MYVAGTTRAVVTSAAEIDSASCLTSLDDATNATPEVADFPQTGAILLTVAHGVVFTLSLTGNAIVLYVIGRHLGYRTATNVYITALCVADVASALVCLPLAGAAIALWRTSFDGQTCVAYDVVRRSLSVVTTSITTALVVDRYMTVVRLRRVQTVIQKTLITVGTLVALSVLASLPWYLIAAVSAVSSWSSSWSWPPVCLPQYVETTVIYDVVYAAVTSALPAVGLACCAVRVLRAVLRSTSAVRPSTSVAGQLLFQHELQTATTVILLVVVFVTCRCVHCMLVGLSAWKTMRSGELVWQVNTRVLMDSAAALAVTVNGAVNPAVYALRNPNVARVLRFSRQQRYGGYVADDIPSTPASHAVAATVTATHREDLVATLSDCSVRPNEPPVETRVSLEKDSCHATDNSTNTTYVVSAGDDHRQQRNQRSWSADFWASRRSSSSFSAPSVIYNVSSSRRSSSQLSSRTASTLTSVVVHS